MFDVFQVVEYRFLKVNYESKITCQLEVDYLRCSPKHYGRPRHDTVIIKTSSGYTFAQLILLFTVVIDHTTYAVALVQIFSREMGNDQTQKKDHDLGFLRLHKQRAQFIWTRSIIRGVPIFPAFDVKEDSVVFDLIDPDITFRVQELLA